MKEQQEEHQQQIKAILAATIALQQENETLREATIVHTPQCTPMAPSAPDSLSFFQLPIPMAESVSPQSPLVETIDNTYSSDEQEYASATKTTSKI